MKTRDKGFCSRRVVSLIVLFFWLTSGFGCPTMTEANAGSTAVDGFASPSTTSMSPDRDYDGLTDDVETGGWSNAAGFFTTDPLDPDSDDDGLSDGEEKLYDTDPLDAHSPGIYVEYEDHLMTRQYSAKDSHSEQPWGWQQFGDRLISFDAVVVRRGAIFFVGGPADATIQVVKSLSYLNDLTPVRDACTGRWRISVPPGSRVGKYEIIVQEGDWSKSLNLYVIFELPTPTSSFTQAMIDTFLYDDDPEALSDETGALLNSQYKEYTHDDYPSRIPEGAWVNCGGIYGFKLQQFEPFVFEEHVIGAINGRRNQSDAADDLVELADEVTRFNNPRPFTSSWRVLHPGADDSQQCSNIAGILVAFERSAGIPSRPLLTDWVHGSFDSAAEIWLNGSWMAARGYTRLEPEGCGWDCGYGYLSPRSRRTWGTTRYTPWHSGGSGRSSLVLAAGENWALQLGRGYIWPSWDWDVIGRNSWVETLFVPYWYSYGWRQEPERIGGPYSWPAITDFATGASPGSRTVVRGDSTSYSVNLEDSLLDFSDLVDLSVSGLPAGASSYFDANDHCVPNCSRTLVTNVAAGTPVGTYELTIQGESGGLVRETIVELVVTGFNIDASPDVRTIKAGDSTSYAVTLEALNGFDDTVDLSVVGVPANTTAYFDDSSWESPYGNNDLHVVTSSSTPAGDFTLTIRGTVGEAVRETTVQLSVTDFTIDASPDSLTVEQGESESVDYTVSLDALNGFDDTVDLYVMGLPANTTYGFSPPSCEPDCTSVLSVVTSGDTPAGDFTLTIHGDSDPPDRQTTVSLHVDEPSEGASARPAASTSYASAGVFPNAEGSRGHHLFKLVPVARPAAGSSSSLDQMAEDGPTGLAVRGVDDYGVDLDGDGYFDQLIVEIEVDAPQPGTYWIQGELGVDHQVPTLARTGGLIATAVVRAELVEGVNAVQLSFEGLRISAAKVDGPYALKYLSVTDVDDPGPDDFVNSSLGHWMSLYTTSAYRAYDFQNWGAALSGAVTERGLDADGDTRYESLTLDVGLDIFEPGTYTVQGDLYDSLDRFVARATWTGSDSIASLDFDELAGTSGPYTLRELSLLNADGEIIDSMVEAYITEQVVSAEDKTHIVQQASSGEFGVQEILPDAYSDSGLDLDGDGLYDLLAIDVQVGVEEAGEHRLEGWLEGEDGHLVSWASSDSISLTVGTHPISLTFSGLAISAHNADGPFTLMALKLLAGDGYEILDEVDVAYTTSAYTRDQFESPPRPKVPPDRVILLEDDMEAGEGSWAADSPWALVTTRYHSPRHTWTDSPGGDYASSTDVSLSTAPLGLAGFGIPVLEFQTCYALETNFDYGYVEVSTDGGVTWTNAATYTGLTEGWARETVELGVTGGAETLQVRVRLDTDAGITADGWYIDDVAIYLDSDLDDDGIPNDVEIGDDPNDPVDTDEDGTPDYLDEDSDGDGIPDAVEVGDNPADPVDTDEDGVSDYLDSDSDDDGIPDAVEAGDDPTRPTDSDGDGVPDYRDTDSDDDTIPDAMEHDQDQDVSTGDDICVNLDVDQDGDGKFNCQDNDVDGDGIPNHLDTDSDDDGLLDSVEAGDSDPSTPPVHSDDDGLPDFVDLDSDEDGIPDADDSWPTDPREHYFLPLVFRAT